MNDKKKYELLSGDVLILLIISLTMFISFAASLFQQYILSGLLLIILSLFSFVYYFRETRNYLNCRGIFFLFWFFAVGLSALKLHPLQTDWKTETWIAIWLPVCFFIAGYNLAFRRRVKASRLVAFKLNAFQAICILGLIIILAFLVETVYSGYIPLFSSSAGAYQEFAMPIVHYITVSCVLLPPITYIEHRKKRFKRQQLYVLVLLNTIMFLIPVLIVSRQLLLMEVFILFLTFLELRNTSKIPVRTIIVLMLIIAASWIFLSSKRNQNDAYLKQVLMLDDRMSVSIYRDYLYIAFNIDNFNAFVGTAEKYSLFYASLTPLLTFTGTDAVLGRFLAVSVIPQVLPTFTTYSFLIAPYQDLGLLGVGLYCIVMGMFCGMNERKAAMGASAKSVMYHVISNYCLAFSFFAPFFSSTSIWGYFIVIYVYDSLVRKTSRRETECH